MKEAGKYYEIAKDEQTRLASLLGKVDPQFAAKASIYARKKYGMRSITHFTSAWIAKNVHGSTWSRKFFKNVVHRVDDVTEILSCYAALNGSLKSLPPLKQIDPPGVRPEIVIDTREQTPLPFARLAARRGTLASGVYSIVGCR